MKIYVCIPSFNESETIGSVATLVDEGLQSLCAIHGSAVSAKIVNVDSASEDGTAEVFLRVATYYPKQSIVLPEPRGKGKNLLAFAMLARSEQATYCLTIDADIRSATPAWVGALLDPLLTDSADFVTPSYERSRFEGSTTNHFAYPLVFATTGRHVRQPIAGDFAFTDRLLDLTGSLDVPDAARYYGIDIYLTLAALTHGLRHREVTLGRKVHGPSFHKLEYMFPQIAAAALHVLREAPLLSSASHSQADQEEVLNIISVPTFPHKDPAKDMQARARSLLMSADSETWSWVPTTVIRKLKETSEPAISPNDWLAVLMGWLRFGLQNRRISVDLLAEQLLPFFVLRATGFWFSSEQMTAEETESEIRQQARLLSARFQEFLSGAVG